MPSGPPFYLLPTPILSESAAPAAVGLIVIIFGGPGGFADRAWWAGY